MQRSRARMGSRAPLLMGLVLMMLLAGCGRSRERLSEDEDEIINGVLSARQTLVRLALYNQMDAANAAAGRGRNPTSLCSGRRIARGVILTAAHCVYGFTMVDVSFPNIPAAGGAPRTYEGVVKGAVAEGYTGDIMNARDLAVLLYDENPNLNLPAIPLGQPQWNAAGGRGRAYGRRQPSGDDGDVDEFFHSPTRFYTHAQMPLTILASTTNPPPAVAGDPVNAPALHGGDSGGPFAVRAAGPGRPLRTVAVNSAQDFECVDDGVPVPGRAPARRCRALKHLKRTYAPAPADWVSAPVGRGYWAGIDNVALAWLNGFVAQAAVNNGAWPAAYDLLASSTSRTAAPAPPCSTTSTRSVWTPTIRRSTSTPTTTRPSPRTSCASTSRRWRAPATATPRLAPTGWRCATPRARRGARRSPAASTRWCTGRAACPSARCAPAPEPARRTTWPSADARSSGSARRGRMEA
jgi:hypothetical protein